jgi:hypothetical protein
MLLGKLVKLKNENTSQKSDLSKPLIACGVPKISSTSKTCDKSDYVKGP